MKKQTGKISRRHFVAHLSASQVTASVVLASTSSHPNDEASAQTDLGGDISKAAKPVVFAGGATPKAVKLRIRT